VIKQPTHQLAGGEQAGDGVASVLSTSPWVVILRPPKVKVRPQVTA